MASCKDCINYDACKVAKINVSNEVECWCDLFKDRYRFVELPCEAYIIIHGGVEQIHLFGCYARYGINNPNRIIRVESLCFGKVLFFTREEAEQALKERENDGK